MTIGDLLEALVGAGIIFTDEDEVIEALEQMGFSLETELPQPETPA